VIREELAGEVGRAVSAGEYEETVTERVLRTRRIDPPRPTCTDSFKIQRNAQRTVRMSRYLSFYQIRTATRAAALTRSV
jgi:hypothetical protein